MELFKANRGPLFSDYNIAVFLLVAMSVQLVYFEGPAVSNIKVAIMAICPLLFIFKTPYLSKAVMYGSLFWIVTVAMNLLQPVATRMSTFYYSLLFLIMFFVYYNLVYYKEVFTAKSFLNIIKGLIFAYAICLILQQICIIVGIRFFPFINLCNQFFLSLFKLPSLAIEPSHAARLLTVFFYAYLKIHEYKNGYKLKIKELFTEHKYVTYAFLYVMLLMGSGTAFIGLGILSLYFMRLDQAFVAVFGFIVIYMVIDSIDYEPLQRAIRVVNATLTGDSAEVARADGSAYARVGIIMDTFKYLDITDPDTWMGKGVDAFNQQEHAVLSAIIDYGLVSYILKLLFFFKCCFNGLFSLEIVMFIILFSMNIGNIAYGWSVLMVFSTIKYFKNTLEYNQLQQYA